MSEERAVGDQSMEDILASIRRIISDEGEEPATVMPASVDTTADGASVRPGSNSAPAAAPETAVGEAAPAPVTDDLSDIVDAARPTGALVTPVSSFGEPPKAAAGEPDGEGSAETLETSTSARMERPASLTERLALRERMAALDLKTRTAEALAKSDVEPVARREIAPDMPVAKSFPAIDLDDDVAETKAAPVAPKPSTNGQAPAVDAEKPVTPAAKAAPDEGDKIGAALAPLARKTEAAPSEMPGGAANRVERKVAPMAAPRPVAGAGSGLTPGGGGREKGSVAATEEKKVAAAPVKAAEPAPGRSVPKAGEAPAKQGNGKGDAGLSATGSGVAIPSSEAVGVAALNKAGEATRKGAAEPSVELIEAAREALHEDSPADDRPGRAGGTAGAGAAVTLEDVVMKALEPVLKTWLDENLPKMIEGQVREEVRRAMTRTKQDRAG